MQQLRLIVRIADQIVAMPADAIESVVELDRVTPAPLAAPHVAGLAALRSRVLTVIDSYAAIGLPKPRIEGVCHAVVVTIDGHSYGLMVDDVEDVAVDPSDPLPVPPALARGWAHVASGIVEREGRSALLVDPARLVAGAAAVAA